MKIVISVVLQIGFSLMFVFLFYKLKMIHKKDILSYVTWYSLFGVVAIYSKALNPYLQQWADVWFICAVSYFVVYEARFKSQEIK